MISFLTLTFKSLLRDPMLRWMLLLPFVNAVAARFAIPYCMTYYPLEPYYPLIVSYLVMLIPALYGCVIGFVLLDEKDDHIQLAIMVSPLSYRAYFLSRLFFPMLLSLVVVPLSFLIINLYTLSFFSLFLMAFASALQAPLFCLLFNALASNKIQGLAIMKGSGILIMLPFIAYFLPPSYEWLFYAIPTYWPLKLCWALILE